MKYLRESNAGLLEIIHLRNVDSSLIYSILWKWNFFCCRLNMELNLQGLFGLLCIALLISWDPATLPPPPTFGLIYEYEGAIGQPR